MTQISRIADSILASLRRKLAAGSAATAADGEKRTVGPGFDPGELCLFLVERDGRPLTRLELEREMGAFISGRYGAPRPSSDPLAGNAASLPGVSNFRSGMVESGNAQRDCPLLVDFLRRRAGR